MKTKLLTVIAIILFTTVGVGIIAYHRLPPAGVNLTGTWHTPPNLGGSVVNLSHTRFGLRGDGYHFTDDGGFPERFSVSGSVSGHVVRLVVVDGPDGRLIANGTNTYVISQSPEWGVYLVNSGWKRSEGTNQSPDWNALMSLHRDWNRLWDRMHNQTNGH